MNNLNETITKVVISEVNASISRKSTGTKIATTTKVIPVIVVPISTL